MAAGVVLLCGSASAQAPATDAVVEKLLDDAAAVSPEVGVSRAAVQAERARVPQAAALPDPTLSVGIQNDGFTRIAIGSAETSWVSVMVTQPLPWPGKRALREQVAELDVRVSEARFQRTLLELDARVRRAYVDLLLARGRLELLSELEALWAQAGKIARARYEAGRVPQSDLLRAQLELARLGQRRWALEAEVASLLAEVNRLRGRPLDLALTSRTRLADVPDPMLPAEHEVQEDAQARSPEVMVSRLGVEQSGRRTELVRKEVRPDFAVSAGLMPRGRMEPMWQVGFSIGLPVWAGRKQGQAVVESEHRAISQAQAAEVVLQILRLRTHERLTVLTALVRTNRRYRDGLLTLSEAATRSALAQYETGQLPFASVLEALAGYVADRGSFLAAIADAQRVAIAQREVSLEPTPATSVGLSGGAMPGGGAARSMPSGAGVTTQPSGGASATTSSGTSGM